MKRFSVVFLLVFSMNVLPQILGGQILSTDNNITVLKVFGPHQQRGYAQGLLLAPKIETIIKYYIIPKFGLYYQACRQAIMDTNNFKYDAEYIDEAKGVASGMNAAGVTTYDYIDILLSNSLLDIAGFISAAEIDFHFGCSSLMSWGDATMNTPLNGKLTMCRHLDWETSPYLMNNQVMVIHIPYEENEQPWIMFGFAGQISALSGTNKAGLSAFQHVLQGVSGRPTTGKKFEPIWFSLRKALERKDYNGDTKNNTEDIRAILSSNTNGYATSCIISSAAPSTNVSDSLIALVSEVTFVAPTHTFRTNSYADSIPGDNLYAANSPIKRLDARAYCTRYLGVVGAIGAGVNVDTSMNWRVLRDYSRVVGSNVQFIQVIPELHTLQLSVYQNSSPAYYNTPRKYDTDTLFVKPQAVSDRPELTTSDFILYQNYPNPFNPFTNIQYQLNEPRKVTLTVFDGLGNEIAVLVNAEQPRGVYSIPFSAVGLPSGNYFYRLTVGNFSTVRKFVLMK